MQSSTFLEHVLTLLHTCSTEGLPNTKVGTFTQELFDEAKKDGWIIVSMKNDSNLRGPLRIRLIKVGRWEQE